MTWVAWRQFRVQAIVAAAFLLLMGVAFALTGSHLLHLYDTTVLHCHAQNDCSTAQRAFAHADKLLQRSNILLVLLPALIGIFWGAPMISREFEGGTYQLAWTQSVTRRRWLTVKILLVGVASVVVTGSFSLMVTWWSSPLDRLHHSPFTTFDHRDLVPMGYAAFALALGVLLSLVIRRTVPAMAATLVGFVGVRWIFSDWIRTHFEAPLRLSAPLQVPPGSVPLSQGPGAIGPADWIISDTTVNAHGRIIGQFGGIGPNGRIAINPVGNSRRFDFAGVGRCPNRFPGGNVRSSANSGAVNRAIQTCINHFHLREVFTFQPASRYWAFQWFELTSFLALTIALVAVSLWLVRRRSA